MIWNFQKGLFNLYNLKVIYCKVLDRYNGSIKVIVSKNLKEKVDQSVYKTLHQEKKFGLTKSEVWEKFKINSQKVIL